MKHPMSKINIPQTRLLQFGSVFTLCKFDVLHRYLYRRVAKRHGVFGDMVWCRETRKIKYEREICRMREKERELR